ncbi:hypothetical protein N9A94_03460 [Akkermansiaceae bacterium]|nr:hypothetical protein [Akkermansiaceae bacterium]
MRTTSLSLLEVLSRTESELDAVAEKRKLINDKKKELQKGKLSKKEQAEELEKFTAKTLTERDEKLLTGITNADYHYKGSAKILGQIGKAFAEANYKLLKK